MKFCKIKKKSFEVGNGCVKFEFNDRQIFNYYNSVYFYLIILSNIAISF